MNPETLDYAPPKSSNIVPFVYFLVGQLPCAFVLLFGIGAWLMFFSPLGKMIIYEGTYFHRENSLEGSMFTPWKKSPLARDANDPTIERTGEISRWLFTMNVRQLQSPPNTNIDTLSSVIHIRYARAIPLAALCIALEIALVRFWLLAARRLLNHKPESSAV
jgi:hypothetical protein